MGEGFVLSSIRPELMAEGSRTVRSESTRTEVGVINGIFSQLQGERGNNF